MTSSTLSAMLQLQGLPPLPRSLSGYSPSPNVTQAPGTFGHNFIQQPQHSQLHLHQPQPFHGHLSSQSSHLGRHELLPSMIKSGHHHPLSFHHPHGRPSPPIPPPRPQSRRSSSSGSSFRASPDHLSNRTVLMSGGTAEILRSSPRSLSSSPHSPHVDSGLGRSSADSFSEGRAFVRVVKSPPVISSRLDAQLAQLKNDMHHLRQQDMALLGHLLQIHQGIQDLRSVLIPPPQPAPSSVLPMFHSTPTVYHGSGSGSTSSSSRHSKHSKLQQQPSQSSRLSILSSGASKLFSRRSSSDKLMAEAMSMSVELGSSGLRGDGGGSSGHGHLRRRERREDEESDSLSSFEFGDV